MGKNKPKNLLASFKVSPLFCDQISLGWPHWYWWVIYMGKNVSILRNIAWRHYQPCIPIKREVETCPVLCLETWDTSDAFHLGSSLIEVAETAETAETKTPAKSKTKNSDAGEDWHHVQIDVSQVSSGIPDLDNNFPQRRQNNEDLRTRAWRFLLGDVCPSSSQVCEKCACVCPCASNLDGGEKAHAKWN